VIGKVSGRLDYVAEDHALIEAAGVGYVIFASSRTLAALPSPGEPAALYTELVVREDLLQLYGFPSLAEKEWHRLLTSVQGVGPRNALAILGTLGPEAVSRAIALGDAGAVRRAPGVGPKLAQRIVMELKEKAPGVMALGQRGARAASPAQGAGAEASPSRAPSAREAAPAAAAPAPDAAGAQAAAQADALSALVNLGYAEGQAAAAVAETAAEAPEADAAALIRAALRALAPDR
jgi:Holliday junction DNA helicase RuvA